MRWPLLLVLPAIAVFSTLRAAAEDAGPSAPDARSEQPPESLVDRNVGYGPLFMRSQALLNKIRLTPLPLEPSTLRAGDLEAKFVTDWSNSFGEKADAYFVDFEAIQFSLRATYA